MSLRSLLRCVVVVLLFAMVAMLCAPVARACDYGVDAGAFSIVQQPVYAQQFVAPQYVVQRQVVAYSQPVVQRQIVRSYSAPVVRRQVVRERVVVPRGRARLNVQVGY